MYSHIFCNYFAYTYTSSTLYTYDEGVPFRETHHIAGKAVRLAEEKNVSLSKLSLEDIKSLHPKFEDDVLNVWTFDMSVERRNSTGWCQIVCV